VLVPVVILGEGLVQAVVEVLVVREDDMASNVPELPCPLDLENA
jgi:hypothetical protein